LDKSESLSTEIIRSIAQQIKSLKNTHKFGIVIGGGNILRGEEQGLKIGLTPAFGHQAGMLATMINGLILQDVFQQEGIATSLLSALFCPQICPIISQQNIQNDAAIIFVGGTGAPYFTTDTNAIVRSLQIGANEVWKATDADGVYTTDPKKDPDATLIKKLKYFDVIGKKLGIMDTTAIALAEKHKIRIRVFNIFSQNAILKASEDESFGSLIN